MVDELMRDLRDVARTLRTHPRFVALVIAGYTIGIGSNTAIFTVVDDVVLDPLPFPDSEELVLVWESHPEQGFDQIPAAPAKFYAWRSERALFSTMSMFRQEEMDLISSEGAERISVGLVLPELFPMLGLEPEMGRTFVENEVVPGDDGVVVLTHAFWSEWMGGDPTSLGGSLSLDGRPYTVIGVLGPGVTFPDGVDLYRPLALENRESRTEHAYRVLARIAPEVDVATAQVGMDAVAARLAAEYPETDRGFEVSIQPLRDRIFGAGLSSSLVLLQGAVAFVLLIACANVASLMLVRSAGRRREFAVRSALGSGRVRLIRQAIVESVALAMAGGVAGLLLAQWAVAGLVRLATVELPATEGLGSDPGVVVFALGLALASGVVFGLAPALPGTRVDIAGEIRGRGSTATRGRARFRQTVVVLEVGLATVLFLGSALFLRSLQELGRVDHGFEPAGVMSAEIRPPLYRYESSAEREALYARLLEELEGRAEVQAVGAVSHLPLAGRMDGFRFQIEGRPVESLADLHVAPLRSVSDGYFGAMGLELQRGRTFEGGDNADGERVAIVNRAMAERFWPGEDPVGQRFGISEDDDPWIRIVGLVEDVRQSGPAEQAEAAFYVPMRQEPWPRVAVVLRSGMDGERSAELIRDAVRAVDPMLPVTAVQTLETLVGRATAPWRFQATLVTLFGAISILLAGLGVYGLLNYMVHERVPEMGVRRALGASSRHIRSLVRSDSLRLGVLGTGCGLVAGVLLARALDSMLFEVSPLDPASYLAAGTALVTVALLAGLVPTRRALAVDPAEVLRGE